MLTDEQAATNWCERAQRYFNDMQTETARREEAEAARQRDRKWLRRVLKATRIWRDARDNMRQQKNERTRDWAEARIARWNACRWSALWKRSAKGHRLGEGLFKYFAFKFKMQYVEVQAERDELRRQLDAIRDDPVSVCEKCDEGQQIIPLQRQCDELRSKVKVLETLADEAGRGGELRAEWALRERNKLLAEVKGMRQEHIIWEKHSLAQIVTERDELQKRLEEARPLLVELRDKSYDSGWRSAKIEFRGRCSATEEFDQRTVIQQRNRVFRELEAALAGGEGE